MILCCDDLVDEIYDLLRENNPFSLCEFDVCYFVSFFEDFFYGRLSPTTIVNELSFLGILNSDERKRLHCIVTSFLIGLRKQIIDYYPDLNQEDYHVEINYTSVTCNLIILKGD